MQEQLNEMGHLTLRAPRLDIAQLVEQGIVNAVVTYYANEKRLRIDSLYEPTMDLEGPPEVRTLICIRDNENATLILEGELYKGEQACLRCANCMVCFTKNACRSFVLSDGIDPLAAAF